MDFSLSERWILHIDMDAFFASIEELDHPEFKNHPLVVGADPKNGRGRGVVSTCNYPARKFGIHSAMPITTAYRLCPHANFVGPHMKRYEEVSKIVKEIFYNYSPSVEPLSLDEAFLDISGMQNFYSSPQDLALKLKKEIFNVTGLTASAGISRIKFIAKIASDMNKPDGLTYCIPGKEREFISELSVGKLWGVGKKTEIILKEMGIFTAGQLSRTDDEVIYYRLKNYGMHLKQLALGIDERSVMPNQKRKSIGEETTFQEDTKDSEKIFRTLKLLSETLASRINREEKSGMTIALKIRLEGFQTYSRSKTLKKGICSAQDILDNAKNIYSQFDTNNKSIRLLGITLSNLHDKTNSSQPDLFNHAVENKREVLDRVLRRMNHKFGQRIKKGIYIP